MTIAKLAEFLVTDRQNYEEVGDDGWHQQVVEEIARLAGTLYPVDEAYTVLVRVSE